MALDVHIGPITAAGWFAKREVLLCSKLQFQLARHSKMAKGKDVGDAYEEYVQQLCPQLRERTRANRCNPFSPYYSIFGGGSDLSDVEDDADLNQTQDFSYGHDDEEDGAMSAAAEAEAVMAEDLGDDEDQEDGDYRQAETGEVNKLPSFKKDPSAKKRDSAAGEQPKYVLMLSVTDCDLLSPAMKQ